MSAPTPAPAARMTAETAADLAAGVAFARRLVKLFPVNPEVDREVGTLLAQLEPPRSSEPI